MSPMPAIVPSARRATIPEMNTSLPLASMVVACEKTPLGWRRRSLVIWRFIERLPLRAGSPRVSQQPAVAAHRILDAESAERKPERGGLTRDHGLAQVVLQALDDPHRGETCPADEDRVRPRRVRGTPQRVRPFLGLLVDVHDAVEPVVRDDVETGGRPVGPSGDGDRLGIRDAKGHATDAE